MPVVCMVHALERDCVKLACIVMDNGIDFKKHTILKRPTRILHDCKGEKTMRSLVISRWGLGRLDSGAALRNMQNISALSAFGTVDVITVDPSGQRTIQNDSHKANSIGYYVPRPSRKFPGLWLLPGRHHTIRHFTDRALVRRLKGLTAADYDLAVVEEISLSAYVAPLTKAGIRTVFDCHNVEAKLWAEIRCGEKRSGTWLSALREHMINKKLWNAEANAVQSAQMVWVCSNIDAEIIKHTYKPKSIIATVPNAINLDYYSEARLERSQQSMSGNPLLIYVGTYSYKPNEVAAMQLINEIVPALRAKGLALDLVLVGRDPTPEMFQAAKSCGGVDVTGSVESTAPFLGKDSVSVMPITIGGGTRLKVLEALASCCPVVCTQKAAEGIKLEHGSDILFADTTEEFVEAIKSLVENPGKRKLMGETGFETVYRSYSWSAVRFAVGEALRIQ